ncbi:MAG TPA: hypothetical protein VMU39_03525 [Solirubrobacteraceae bacterium]|nr:hypothetical protein [Solirubrobacteraceae bacterium]
MDEHAPRPRIRTGELISAACALLLAPMMFVLEWYGVVGVPGTRRSGITTAENAWQTLTYTRWVMVVAIVVALGSVCLHITQRSHGAKTDTSIVVATIGTIAAVLLVYRVLIEPPNPSSVVDVKIGAFLGLLAAIGIAIGGIESIREERARRDAVVQRSRPRRRIASRSQAR